MIKEIQFLSKQRNSQIEGLRGIAILVIVAYHMFDRYQQIYLNNSIPWMDSWGTFGVAIFFILSFYFLFDFKCVMISWKEGMILFFHKILRLWPCYAVAVTTIFIVTHIWLLPGRTVDVKSYLSNLIFINRFFALDYVDGAHWYLRVLVSIIVISILIRIAKIYKNPLTYIIWITLSAIINYIIVRSGLMESDIHLLGGPYVCYVGIVISMRVIIEGMDVLDVKNLLHRIIDNWKWSMVALCWRSLLFCRYFYYVYLEELGY